VTRATGASSIERRRYDRLREVLGVDGLAATVLEGDETRG
jgi:hypothetical protein